MIRLLKKEEISQAKQNDVRREIEEGMKLSRRVDNLRELTSKEEEQFEKFKIEALSAISKEIGALSAERDAIALQIAEFRQEMASETNLSKEERKNLETLKQNLSNWEEELKKKKELLDFLEIDIAVALKGAEDSLARNKSHEEIAKNLQVASEKDRIAASQVIQDAEAMQKNTHQAKKDSEAEISMQKAALSTREIAVREREEENIAISRDLEAEKMRVHDREATLERELQRIRNNRL